MMDCIYDGLRFRLCRPDVLVVLTFFPGIKVQRGCSVDTAAGKHLSSAPRKGSQNAIDVPTPAFCPTVNRHDPMRSFIFAAQPSHVHSYFLSRPPGLLSSGS
jgi:hypothetical protein